MNPDQFLWTESFQRWKHAGSQVSSPNFCVPEILRGIIKRKNLQELGNDEAQKIIDSILVDIDTRILNGELQVLALNDDYLPEVKAIDPFIQLFCH